MYIPLVLYFARNPVRLAIFAPDIKRETKDYDMITHARYLYIAVLCTAIWSVIIDIIHESVWHDSFARHSECPNYYNAQDYVAESEYERDATFYNGCLMGTASLAPTYQIYVTAIFMFHFFVTVKDEFIQGL